MKLLKKSPEDIRAKVTELDSTIAGIEKELTSKRSEYKHLLIQAEEGGGPDKSKEISKLKNEIADIRDKLEIKTELRSSYSEEIEEARKQEKNDRIEKQIAEQKKAAAGMGKAAQKVKEDILTMLQHVREYNELRSKSGLPFDAFDFVNIGDNHLDGAILKMKKSNVEPEEAVKDLIKILDSIEQVMNNRLDREKSRRSAS